MKTINFKIYSLMLAVFAFLALSGCGSSSSSPVTQIPDAGTSTVTADPVSVLADGTTTSTITVTVNDGNSAPITDANVSLEDDTDNSTISAVTNEGDGTYTFTVKSSTPEIVTYTATADGVVITQTANVTFTQTEAQCLAAAGGYVAIEINSRTWLDRNLGASQAATDTNDSAAYGDLYQWGRFADGHQKRDSNETNDLATTLDNQDDNTTAWYGDFIMGMDAPYDWVDDVLHVDDNGSLRSASWSKPYDDNQVCPCGYVVASEQDFADLNITASKDTDTFKLVYAGLRWYDDGRINQSGNGGNAYFWTDKGLIYRIGASTEGTQNLNHYKAYGSSVRCIKPLPLP